MKRGNRLLAILLALLLAVGAVKMPVAAGEASSEYATVEDMLEMEASEAGTSENAVLGAMVGDDTSGQTAADDDSIDVSADETTAANNENQEASDDAAANPVDDIMSEDDIDEGSDQRDTSEDSYTEEPVTDNSTPDGAITDDQDDSYDSSSQGVSADNEQQAGVDDNADEENNGTGGGDFEENPSDSFEESTSSENAIEENETQPALLTPEQIRAFQENVKVWKHENQITVIYDSKEVVTLRYSIYSGVNDVLLYSGNLIWNEQSNLYQETIDFDAMNETRKAEDENTEEINIRYIPLKIVVDDGNNQFEESVSSDLGVTSIDAATDTEGQIDLLWESSIDDLNGYSVLVRNVNGLDVQVIETTERSMSFYTSEIGDAVFEVAAYMYDDNTGIKQYFQSVSYDYAASTLEEPVVDDGNGGDANEEQDDESSMDPENADDPIKAQETNEEASERGKTDEQDIIADPLLNETVSTEAAGAASFSQTEYNGHMYQLFNEGVSWSTAKSRCEARGGHLVTITSAAEHNFCKSLLDNLSPKYCWIGASSASGTWKWVTGETWGYTDWSPTSPNGSGGGTYIEMQNWPGISRAWNWDDQGNSGTSPSKKYQGAPYYHLTKNYCYICEWEEKVSGLTDNTDDYQRASRKISIKWNGVSSSTRQYQIQYSTDKDFIQNVITNTVKCKGTGSYTTEELERSKKYFFRVRVINKYSNNDYPGVWSDVISVKTCNSLLVKELWGFQNPIDSIGLSYFQHTFSYESAIGRVNNSGGNGNNGVCNGMCLIASLIMDYKILKIDNFNAENLYTVKYENLARDFIRYAQAWGTFRKYKNLLWYDINDYGDRAKDQIDEDVKKYQNDETGRIVAPIITLTQINKTGTAIKAEHVVIGLAFIEKNDKEALIKVYDPNYPGEEDRYIHLKEDDNKDTKGLKWEYKFDFMTTYSGYVRVDLEQFNKEHYESGNDNDIIFYNTKFPTDFWNAYQNSVCMATITGISDKIYTGEAITQNPVLKMGRKTLIKDIDYQLHYEDNTDVGTGKVIIDGMGNYDIIDGMGNKGMGNYRGCVVKTFKITRKANQSITVKSTASTITVGKTATVSITGAKGKKSYKSSDPSIATVSAAGVVTGKKPGTVTITATSAETANYKAASKTVKINVGLAKPENCRFVKWNNAKYTSCQIAWDKVKGAEGYQTLLCWTNGSNVSKTIVDSNVLYRNCSVHPQHVSQMRVRAFYTQNGQHKFGPWSNVEYITPSPTTLTINNASSGSNLKMNISWNIIYGCDGYNVFLTTDPNGKWYWNQSTPVKATATSAVISEYKYSTKLEKNTRYYVRIVTRRQRNGVFCTVPMPANNTYIDSFIIK